MLCPEYPVGPNVAVFYIHQYVTLSNGTRFANVGILFHFVCHRELSQTQHLLGPMTAVCERNETWSTTPPSDMAIPMCVPSKYCFRSIFNNAKQYFYPLIALKISTLCKSLHSRKSFVVTELSFARMTALFEGEQTSLLQLITRVSQV